MADSHFPDGKPAEEQPLWRQEFPIETAQDEYVSRRDFAKFLVLTSGAMAVGQACLVVQVALRRATPPPAPKAIAPASDVHIGQVVRFDYPEPGEACLLVRLADGQLVAFGQKCTHLSCAVVPDLAAGRFACPCHNGSFDATTGRPLAGPPRRPLPRVRLETRSDGVIYATGVELST